MGSCERVWVQTDSGGSGLVGSRGQVSLAFNSRAILLLLPHRQSVGLKNGNKHSFTHWQILKILDSTQFHHAKRYAPAIHSAVRTVETMCADTGDFSG